MEAGTAGVSVLEAGERLAVVGIGLGELMRVAVSVNSGDIREIARHLDRALNKSTQRSRAARCVHVFPHSLSVSKTSVFSWDCGSPSGHHPGIPVIKFRRAAYWTVPAQAYFGRGYARSTVSDCQPSWRVRRRASDTSQL